MDPHTTVRESPDPGRDADRTRSPSSADSGARLGRYPVTGQLGAGGMGAVLRVTDPGLGREMAAKVVLDPTSPDGLARFVREAQITGRLEHPGIPPVHELGVAADGRVYFTMKRVVGRDLGAVIADLVANDDAASRPDEPGSRDRRARRAEASPASAATGETLTERLEVFLRITDAVAFAHSKGVIHRDLKPANVMVGAFGEVLVMDWGLARTLDHPADASAPPPAPTRGVAPTATQDGSVVGTPAYMPPEQARGEISSLDERADIYALGAMLYELVTLEPPYAGHTVWHVLDQVLAGPPTPPRERTPHRAVPWELEAVILRAMARDPAHRYPTATALRADVVAYLEGRRVRAARYGVVAALTAWARAHRHALVACALAVAAGATVLGGVLVQRRRAIARLLNQAAAHAAGREPQAAVDALEEALALAPGEPRALAAHATLLATEAARALAGVAGPAELEAEWRARLTALAQGEPERPPTPVELGLRETRVDRYLAAVAWLDRALPSAAEILATRRIAAVEGLAWAALLGRDYTLVRQAQSALAQRGDAGRTRAALLAEASSADRNAQVALWCRRVGVAALDIAAGLGRDGRAPGAPLRDDYEIELAGYRHPTVALELGRLLDGHLVARASERDAVRPWSQAERDLASVLAHALGALQLPESVDPLARWLAAVTERALAVEAAIALCNTRQAAAEAPLLAARDRWGIDSDAWHQVRRYFPRVPNPDTAGAELPPTAAACVERGLVCKDKGDLDGAVAVYTRAIELDPLCDVAFHGRGLVHASRRQHRAAISDYDRALALAPRNAATLNNRGLARSAVGDLDGALADFDLAIELEPNDGLAYANRASLHDQRGARDLALADYDRAIRIDGSRAPSFSQRGDVHQRLGDLDRALADYDRALELDPELAYAYGNRGAARQRKGDIEGAIADYDRAIALDPRMPNAYCNRGNLRLTRGDRAGAMNDFDQALELDSRDTAALNNRGNARRQAGDFAGALSDLDRAFELDGQNAEILTNRALVRMAQGDFAGALADHDRAVALDPHSAKALTHRGVARQAQGDREGALADFERAIALDPRYALAYNNRGRVRKAMGDRAGALADFERAIVLDPALAAAWFHRGVLRQTAGDVEGALADYDRTLVLDPRDAMASSNRGALRLARGDVDGALADHDRAIAIDPGFADAYNNRGLARSAKGDVEEALSDFDRAIELTPGRWQTWGNRGELLARLGRRELARASLKRALALAPPAAHAQLEALLRPLERD